MPDEASMRNQHVQEVLAQGRARAASNTAWLEQSDQLLRRGKAELYRQQASPPDGHRSPPSLPGTAPPPPPSILRDPAPLRRHLAETLEQLARTESRVAQLHDQMASRSPDNAAQLRQIADEAREQASRAHRIVRRLRALAHDPAQSEADVPRRWTPRDGAEPERWVGP